MLHKSAGEDHPFRLKTRFLAELQQRPGWLGAERFGEQPAATDAVLAQGIGDGIGVITHGPGDSAGISYFDKPHAVAKRDAKTHDERPIAVQTRYVNESWLSRFTEYAELQAFRNCGFHQRWRRIHFMAKVWSKWPDCKKRSVSCSVRSRRMIHVCVL